MAVGDLTFREGYQRAITEALSSADVASRLGLTPVHVRRLTRDITLPYARQIGGSWVYWPEDVAALQQREDGRSTRWLGRDES